VKREAEENFGALTFSGSVPPVRAAVKLNDVALSLRAVGGLEQVRLCVFRTDALGRRWLICIIFDAKIVRAAETGLALFKTVVLRKLCKQRRAGWLLGKLGRGLGPARSIVMREVVIAILAAFLIGIMVAALVVHFLL